MPSGRDVDCARRSSSSGSGAVDVDVALAGAGDRESPVPDRGVGRAVGRSTRVVPSALLALVGGVRLGRAGRAHRPDRAGRLRPSGRARPARRCRERRAAATASSNVDAVLDQRLSGRRPSSSKRRRRRSSPRSGSSSRRLNGKVLVDRERRRAHAHVGRSSEWATNRRVQANQDVRFRKLDLDPAARAHAQHAVGRVLPVRRRARADDASSSTPRVSASPGSSARSRSSAVASASRISRCTPWAIALLVFGMFGLAIDVQAGGLGPWTFIGGARARRGFDLCLYGGSTALDPAWWILVLVCGAHVALHALGHDGDGPVPVLDADDRPRRIDRRDGRRRGRCRPGRCRARPGTRCGGPARTGRRRSPRATRCGSSRSRASCSRSSPRRAEHATTATFRPALTALRAADPLFSHARNFLLSQRMWDRYVPPR